MATETLWQREPRLASEVVSLTDNACGFARRTARRGQEVVRDQEANPNVSLAGSNTNVAMVGRERKTRLNATPMTQTVRPSKATLTLSLAALGIVFGDLGTSPLYALQEAFHGDRGVAPSPENVVGCLSLFLWSLIIMVSLKYVLVLMRADNHG